MPILEKIGSLKNPRNFVLFLATILVLAIFAYYLNIRSSLVQNQPQPIYEQLPDENGNSRIIKRQYPSSMSLPDFIQRSWFIVPDEYKTNYDLHEVLSVRVVSTGKVLTTKITDPKTSKELAWITGLEVRLDDRQGYIENNQPFNISLKVYPKGSFKRDLSPPFILNLIKQKELYEPDNEEYKTMQQRYLNGELTSNEVESLLKKDTVLTIEPYLKSNFINQNAKQGASDEDAQYVQLMDRYYEGGDSNFMQAVFSKSTAGIKNPVMIWSMYVSN
jgi:hypothetical protein